MAAHKERMKNSVIAIDYMESKNINNISKLIKTTDNKLYIDFNGGILVIYEFIKGEINYSISYKRVIENLIDILKLPINNEIDKETFNIEKIVEGLEKNINKSKEEMELFNVLEKYKAQINLDIENFKKISTLISKDTKMFITHGDASVNIMETDNGEFLTDWDEVLIAPLERDCWVFMNYEEKIYDINNILKQNNINNTLSKEMLTFYAYKSYIIYLTDTIDKYLELKNPGLLSEFDEFFSGWVRERLDSKIAKSVI